MMAHQVMSIIYIGVPVRYPGRSDSSLEFGSVNGNCELVAPNRNGDKFAHCS